MSASAKILWVVNYNSLEEFLDLAKRVGATSVAIRTDNDVAKAIPQFHAQGIKVIGWRWPSAHADAAMKEAQKVVSLFAAGMDGYYVDPEGAPGRPYDWDRVGLDALANHFCGTIKSAAGGRPFGVTSHYRAKATFPHLPWSAFFHHATELLPQAYWRSTEGTIGHGLPADNFERSLQFWTAAGGNSDLIHPMGGELGSSTAKEIETYATAAAAHGIEALHFYAADATVSEAVWDAVAAA